MVEAVQRTRSAIVFGAEPNGFFTQSLVIVTEARRPASAARSSSATAWRRSCTCAPGATLAVKGHPLRVAGVYHSGILFEDSGAVLALAAGAAPRRTRPVRRPTWWSQLAPTRTRGDAARVRSRARFPGTQVITDPQQALRAGANGTLISKAILVIVVIALLVGALSVANTMAMSIIERQSELGLLSTVGWSPLARRLADPRRRRLR